MATHLITGGAGFVGVNLAARLLDDGDQVVAVDDLSRGRRDLVAPLEERAGFRFMEADCRDADRVVAQLDEGSGVDSVWHLAANSDIPAGVEDPSIDLDRTFITTYGALRIAKAVRATAFNFASSSAIYGDFGDEEITELSSPLEPISNYGAMKLASEAMIRAFVESTLPRANIYRFPNVVGIPATHGVILDLVRKLKATPDALEVLGDGTQQKSYLHVDDLVAAMLHINGLEGRHLVFNIGPSDEGVTVRRIAETVRDRVSPRARIAYGEGPRGWVGDVPKFRYSTAKLQAAGWSPSMASSQAVARAVDEIARQEGAG